MEKLIGKRLDGRYLLEEMIGSGGMANVYKARDLKTEQTVAVKILREEFMSNEELVRRFKNESKAISILDHPHILKVYDVSVTDKLQYIVMEYLDGITLKEYMKQRGGPLTWKETVHFAQQILEALDHAHRKGVVHRDVKPQNVMLLPSGQVKMMDFGIARISRAENHTQSDKAIGSVHYISPEQARGDVTGATADIYSLGVMLYEMLSGRLPFESDNMVSVAIKQISDKARPLSEIAPEVPGALQEITERAMAKRPEDRYPSARAMLDDLEEFKKNPSIRFEYQYLTDTQPERYIDKVVKQTKAGGGRPQPPRGGSPRKPAKKKKRRFPLVPIMLGMAAAFAIGAGILCYMIFANSTNPLFSTREDVELVNFVGQSREQIEANSEYRSHFRIKFIEEYNAAPAGQVYSQTPKPPRTVKEGQTITLRVSLGTRYVEVPSVANYLQKDAEAILKELGLSVNVRPVEDGNVPVGTVVSTTPEAGQQIAAGETVYLYVSREKVETDRVVPDLASLTREDAIIALRNASLVLGQVTEGYSEVEEGRIVDQSPAAGTTVKMNTKVNIAISLGPEPTPEPTDEPEPDPTPMPTIVVPDPTPMPPVVVVTPAPPPPTPAPTPAPPPTQAPTPEPEPSQAPTAEPTQDPTTQQHTGVSANGDAQDN